MNIRNPWGGFEWDGDWSDNSDKWTEEMIKAFGAVLDEEDGSFWMSFADFTKQFTSLDVCRVASWNELRLRGRFIRYQDLNDPDAELVVSKWIYGLEVPSKTHVAMGCVILKREEEGSSLHMYKEGIIGRDLEIECILEPGSYIVVPRTTGCGIKKPLNVGES